MQQEWYLSQISLLFPVNTILAAYICMLCINIAMYTICHYVINTRQH